MSVKKKFLFKSEVKELLNLMINSLYSNKDIFLRELLSNSSDAIDKLRFFIVSNKDKNIKFNDNFYIRLLIKGNKLIIRDNGIGMSYDEIINNLGTIAKSGTKEFLNKINKNNNLNDNLIGKFGVGFYSSFIVSNKVKVHTRHILENNKNNSILWSSKGDGKFFVKKLYKKKYGTDIILYLKESCKEYLNKDNLFKIINKYSNYINIPIQYKFFNKDIKKYEWKRINKYDAIWLKDKSCLSDKEYKNFYYNLTNNLGNPIIWSHNKVEGLYNYISLLYIPDTSPWNIWNRDEYKNSIKLYIKRIFIMDDIENLIPYCFRFVQGIIDTDDLPLNISREILQNNDYFKKISISLTNRIFKMINDLSLNKDKYNIFWKQFGFILKEGLADNNIDKNKISCLLRFNSSKFNSDIFVSLEDYLNRMKIGQDKIFYITSDNYISAKNSPHLELYNKKEIEVLFMLDKIDEWMMNYLTDFKGINFCSINKDNVNLSNIISKNEEIFVDENNSSFLNRIKLYLSDLVKDVRLTNCLDKFPVVLVTDSKDISTQMLKLLRATGKDVPKIKYYLDININHILIKYIRNIKDDIIFKKWVMFIYYQALLIETNSLDDSVNFINLVNDLINGFIIL